MRIMIFFPNREDSTINPYLVPEHGNDLKEFYFEDCKLCIFWANRVFFLAALFLCRTFFEAALSTSEQYC